MAYNNNMSQVNDGARELAALNEAIAEEQKSVERLAKLRIALSNAGYANELKNIAALQKLNIKNLNKNSKLSKDQIIAEKTLNSSINKLVLDSKTRIASIQRKNAQIQFEIENTQLRQLTLTKEELEAESFTRALLRQKELAEKELQLKKASEKTVSEYRAELLHKETLKRKEAEMVALDIAKQRVASSHDRDFEKLQKDKEKLEKKLKKENEKASEDKKLSEKELKKKISTEKSKLTRQFNKKEKEKEQKFKDQALSKAYIVEKKEEAKALEKNKTDLTDSIFGKGNSLEERLAGLSDIFTNGIKGFIAGSSMVLSNLAQQLDSKIEEIALYKGQIDTRLQGSEQDKFLGSYWDKINNTFTQIAGVSPFISRDTLTKNLAALVDKGIAFNVDQRAFLATISEKIATTFDATNGTLLRLVRIQQKDTTAARLGMESALTSFLNNMYETSEYMSDLAASVKGNLEEAMSLMSAEMAVGFEYEVQKWMGSMYSVGMSDKAVSAISTAIGQIASGDISGVTGDGASNLVIMAANQAGLSIADILNDGLSSDETNKLLYNAVQYLGDIYTSNEDSKVVQQQMANVFGVAASDLKAAANLAKANDRGTITSVLAETLDYSGALSQLKEMSNSMIARTSMGEMTGNMWKNFQYTMAGGIANNPVLYGIYKIGSLLKDTTGGIQLPAFSVMGNMVDLDTSVADLMMGGAMGGSILSGIAQLMIGGGGFSTWNSLKQMGLDDKDLTLNMNTTSEGLSLLEELKALEAANLSNSIIKTQERKNSKSGGETSTSGSISTTVGNSSSEDIKSSTISSAENDANSEFVEAKESEENEVTIETVNENVVKIYSLLVDVTEGTSSFTVSQLYPSEGTGWQ